MPSPSDEEQFAAMRGEVARLFRTHERLDKVRMLYDTRVFLGKISI
jgi:hypothetical protein